MQITDMNPTTADAIRAELSAIGTGASSLQRRQRRGRTAAALAGLVVIAGATTGAALVVNTLPGTTTTAPLGTVTTATGTGPAFVDLGGVPKLAGSVIVTLTCLNNVGTVTVPTTDGGGEGVNCAQRGSTPLEIRDAQLPAIGSTKISIESSAETQWRITAQYASSTVSKWGVNADGQTFGVANRDGDPDLTAVTATNGQQGYVVTKDLLGFDHTGSLNVYKSDGTTVIGHYDVTIVPNLPANQQIAPDQVQTPTH